MVGSGMMRVPAWSQPISAGEKQANQQGWHNAFGQYSTTGDMSGVSKMLDGGTGTAVGASPIPNQERRAR
jgi:hypothetical protein